MLVNAGKMWYNETNVEFARLRLAGMLVVGRRILLKIVRTCIKENEKCEKI